MKLKNLSGTRNDCCSQLGITRSLDHDFRWTLITAPSKKRRLSQLSVLGPFGESNLTDKMGSDPLVRSGIFGGFTTGDLSINSGFKRSIVSCNPFSLNPLPECPK